MLNTAKIDSLKLRVSERYVEIVDPTFSQKYQKLYCSSGLIDEEVKLDNHKVDLTDGISTRIGIAYFRNGNESDGEPFYYFQLNSKMLKSDYLNGIREDNILSIYNYIIALKIVYIEYDDFLRGEVTDIDIAYDIEGEPQTLIELLPKIMLSVLPKKQRFIDKAHLKKENVGVSFNKREKASNSAPFIKIYHKSVELKYHSNEFAKKFLADVNYENIVRIELTLKNRKHRKYLNIEFDRLEQLLSFDNDELTKIVSHSIRTHYMENKPINRVVQNSNTLAWYEIVISVFIQEDIEKGNDNIDIYRVLNAFPGETESEQRLKRKVRKSLDKLIGNLSQKSTIDKLDKNKKERNMLRALNIENNVR